MLALCLFLGACDSGHVGPGRVVRDDPLKNPITVREATPTALTLQDGRVIKLAGIVPANQPNLEWYIAHRAGELVQNATLQGVEMVREIEPGSFLVRCEPRIWHWCGNDSVRAHYEQFFLQELLLASGYCPFSPSSGLTTEEASRLRAAEAVAKDLGRGSGGTSGRTSTTAKARSPSASPTA